MLMCVEYGHILESKGQMLNGELRTCGFFIQTANTLTRLGREQCDPSQC